MAAPGPYDDTIRFLVDLARPRPVRMSFKGQFMALLTFPGPLVLFALIANDGRHHPTPGITIAGLATFFGVIEMFLVGLLWLWPCLKQKRLVSVGELAIGEITEVDDSPRNPWVRYKFETPLGEKLTSYHQTYRVDLARGMKVPVFYDLQKPKKQVALCSAYYEVPLPSDGSRRGIEWIEWALTLLAVVGPAVLLVHYLGRPDLIYPAIIVGSALAIASKVTGNIHMCWWFWVTMIPVAGAHVLFLLKLPMPKWVPAPAITGIVIGDVLAIIVLLRLVAKLVGGGAAVREYFPNQKEGGS
jgi:hypothetical protein